MRGNAHRLRKHTSLIPPAIRIWSVTVFLLLVLLFLSGCRFRQEVLVYEKLPQFQECLRYADYMLISVCEKIELRQQNVQVGSVLDKTSYRLERLYNQGDRCDHRSYDPPPAGCHISIIPRRGTRPVVNQGLD